MLLQANPKNYWNKFKKYSAFFIIVFIPILIIALLSDDKNTRMTLMILDSVFAFIMLSNVFTLWAMARTKNQIMPYVEIDNGNFKYGMNGVGESVIPISDVSVVIISMSRVWLKKRGLLVIDVGIPSAGFDKADMNKFVEFANSVISQSKR